MEYRTLGRTGVKVSNPCLGTMTFGWEPDDWGSTEKQSVEIADAAWEAGINFYDTADMYGRGSSETILGKWLKDKKIRDGVVLATKFHNRMSDTDPNQYGNSRRHVIQACEASLKRLQTDWIDLYQVHRPHGDVPIDETLRALDDLVRQGKVRYIGCSTFGGWQVAEAHYVAKMLGLNTFVSEQPPYNLLDRRIERELLPFTRTYDYAVIPWSPLAGGQLSGKYLQNKGKDGRYGKSDPGQRINKQTTSVVRKLDKVAKRFDLSLTQLSLAWVAGSPGITAPIIGARSVKQLTESIAACQTPLAAKVFDAIDKVVEPGSSVSDYYTVPLEPTLRPLA